MICNALFVLFLLFLGQAGAIRLAISRALINFEDSYLEPLQKGLREYWCGSFVVTDPQNEMKAKFNASLCYPSNQIEQLQWMSTAWAPVCSWYAF